MKNVNTRTVLAVVVSGWLGLKQYTPHPRAQTPAATAKLGKAAPDFTLTDSDGKPVKLSELRGKTVVLEWFNPDCPFIKYAHSKGPLKDFAKRVSNAQLVWLSRLA